MLDDLYHLRERAKQAQARGDLHAAADALITAARQTHVAENEYVAVLIALEQVLTQRGEPREALSVAWYLSQGKTDGPRRAMAHLADVPPVDRARTLAAAGDFQGAAGAMEDAGLVAAAAVYRESGGDFRGARALWARLSQVPALGANPYHAALVQFNLARCAKKCDEPGQAREALVVAVRLLEEAADQFESKGRRERAFDCFQVLVQIGRESGMFEDVLEGFVNCIRILREDHLKYFALQYYEDALRAARERGELSAAATLAREAATYARSLGMTTASAHYTLTQAKLWREVAHQQEARDAPPEIAENALLAAVLAFGEMGQFARVGGVYAELAGLALEPARRAHYARAMKRYAEVKDEVVEAAALPAHLRQDDHFPDVWHVDMLEWEQRGSAAEACADVLLDTHWPELVRRKALLARLTALYIERQGERESAETGVARVRLAAQLAELQLYAVLSPLERLFERPEQPVKLAVLAAMQTLFFKRTFVTVQKALRDPDPVVVSQAAKTVESLYFQHAFDPLSRIVRESTTPEVRTAALRALCRVDTPESAEFLLGVLEHGAPADRHATVEGLKRARGARFVELAQSQLTSSPPAVQTALREVLAARGIR